MVEIVDESEDDPATPKRVPDVISLRATVAKPWRFHGKHLQSIVVVDGPSHVLFHVTGPAGSEVNWEVIKELLEYGYTVKIETTINEVSVMDYGVITGIDIDGNAVPKESDE